MAAAIANVLPVAENQVWLYNKLEIETDLLLGEAATVFVLNVPSAYWKVVVVKPFSEAAMATYSLVQAEKMASLSRLVGGMAHEINNPIGFIYGNLNFARDYSERLLHLVKLYQQHYPEPVAPIRDCLADMELDFIADDLRDVFQSMQDGADRVRQIVQALRSFARMDESESKAVNLHDDLESALLLLSDPLQNHGHPIGVQRQYGDLPPVECYASLLNQVWMNILWNAIEAFSDCNHLQPTIWLRTWQPSREQVAIAIRDNGAGMSESVRSQIFNPFFSTKAVGKGTGLGLAISHQIVVAKHNGELTCNSTPGVGSEFRIVIPVRLTT
ncbi:MAG: HAMP domain-containing histidine kinase [Spirulinaceae cyanobacterium SM2_1_0]|nr:HAMP domain-containing histidine kinase [Spirulinaceae cyanobacterium SM2_1_0]